MATPAATSRPISAVRTENRAAVETENWKLLRYFNYYRLAIAAGASAIAITTGTLPPFGSAQPGLFAFAAYSYLVLALATLVSGRLQRPDFPTQAELLGFADVTLLTMLMHASGGVGSGAELLLLVAIAGISLLLGKRLTLFYASAAAIAVLLQHGWDMFTGRTGWEGRVAEDFSQAGLFGIALYATALLGHMLALRLRATEELAEQRSVEIASLSQLNALVIERLQSGVLVCEPDGAVRLINRTAQKFLGCQRPAGNLTLNDIAPDLAAQFAQWLNNESTPQERRVVRSRHGYTLLPRFAPLGDDRNGPTLVFLEDMSVLRQQAQQLKMAALARLTASIAHEIRNPLGALSNAAQLLSESADGSSEEMRLVQIIGEQARRMNVIVHNVTQLSRRDRANMTRLTLDVWLHDFVRQFSETMSVPKEAFARDMPKGLQTCFDPEQLYQVVSNLCQNALRHSPPFSGVPLVKFQAGIDPEGRPHLDVIDWGRGVAPEVADNIFDPFFTTTPKGTGLGLYIARELCEGNGGALDHHPGEGGIGARFRVTFASAEDCAEAGMP